MSEPVEVLAALSGLAAQRADLDRVERDLIDEARELGLGWGQIATALGLRSRQAAEQRRLRLSHLDGRDPQSARRQRNVDTPQLRELRQAVRAALRELGEDWDGLAPRAHLARTSLEEAAEAAGGALFALCRHALADLATFTVPARPAARRAAIRRLTTAFGAATPG